MKEVRLKRRHCRIPAVCQFGEKAELWRQRKIAGGQGRGAGGRLGGAQGTSGAVQLLCVAFGPRMDSTKSEA